MKKPLTALRAWHRHANLWLARRPYRPPGRAPRPSTLTLEALEPRALPSFLAPVNYDAGATPNAVAVADFNGDGLPDLVAANGQGGTVTVRLGRGDGSFQAPRSYPAGLDGVLAVVVGDFNGDGTPDLAVTSLDGNGNFELSVLAGNGDGSFTAPQSTPLTINPSSIAVGDFNADGRLDLALSGSVFGQGGMVSVFLGNGDGSFQHAFSLAVGASGATSVAVADFNGDGRPDLVVSSFGFPVEPPNVLLLLGNGDGTFRVGNRYDAGDNLLSVVVGDFNGDGYLDVAALDDGSGASVLLGNRDGSFQDPLDYTIEGATSLAAGDTNGDGLTDLVVAGPGTGTVLLGNGDGVLRVGSSFDLGPGALVDFHGSTVLADLNGDGVLDVVSANPASTDLFAAGDTVSVRLGNGDGSFQTTPRYDPGTALGDAVVAGDFNGDGIQDLARVKSTSGNVSVLLGNGDGSFRLLPDFPTARVGRASLAVGDFNGDGIPDLVVARAGILRCIPHQGCTDTPGSLTVLLGNGDGTFRTSTDFTLDVTALAVADFNGDGLPDLALSYRNPPDSFNASLMVLLGNGDGTFRTAQDSPLPGPPSAIAPADVNRDGNVDLVMTARDAVGILTGNGDGTFQFAGSVALPGLNVVTVADVNSDGTPDLIATAGGVSILLGNGDGTFRTAQSIDLADSPGLVVAADFNNDGVADLAVATGSGVKVFLGNGDGTFQDSSVTYGTVPGSGLVAADVNGDGFSDLATGDGLLLPNAADWSSAPAAVVAPHRGVSRAVPRHAAHPNARPAVTTGKAAGQLAKAAAVDRLFAPRSAMPPLPSWPLLPSAHGDVGRETFRDRPPAGIGDVETGAPALAAVFRKPRASVESVRGHAALNSPPDGEPLDLLSREDCQSF